MIEHSPRHGDTAGDRPDRFAYFGPEGTFTEAALRTLPEAASAVREPYPTVPAALDAVRRGATDAAMVPLENSVEGPVTTTVDDLADGDALMIVGEVLLPVEFALLVRPGTRLEDVKRVCTHPHAYAQCRRWLAANLPDAEVATGTSTAGAAMTVSDPTSGYDAAIAAPIAGERYGLVAAAHGIADRSGAVTRFVLVRRPGPPAVATGSDRTSLMAYLSDDHPGALLEFLTEFAVRGVNLTLIQSRPTGDGFGRYRFWIDCEGHVADARVGEALMGLRRVCADVRFLGSYPRAGHVRAEIRRGTHDADFGEASAWLSAIRSGHDL
ncbi:MAG: Prephenate dehydratase [Actinoallomurus sp.]|nr:Prephenate dehydratase [Actinoallomurus sp.]